MNDLSTIELGNPVRLAAAGVAGSGSGPHRRRKRLHGMELPSSDLAEVKPLV
jgi:hypothetical protein